MIELVTLLTPFCVPPLKPLLGLTMRLHVLISLAYLTPKHKDPSPLRKKGKGAKGGVLAAIANFIMHTHTHRAFDTLLYRFLHGLESGHLNSRPPLPRLTPGCPPAPSIVDAFKY